MGASVGSGSVSWDAVDGASSSLAIVQISPEPLFSAPSSTVVARPSDGGNPKPAKSILQSGFLNPRLLWSRAR